MNPEKPTIKNNIIVLIFTFWLLDAVFGILYYSGLTLKSLVTNILQFDSNHQYLRHPWELTSFLSPPCKKKLYFNSSFFQICVTLFTNVRFFGHKNILQTKFLSPKIFIYSMRSAPACRNMLKINNLLFLTTRG